MSKKTYPNLMCWECIGYTGKDLTKLGDREVTQLEDVCGICKRKGIVVAPADLGHFSQDQLSLARAEVKRLGLKSSDAVDPKTVDKALTIVAGVLGDTMSLWTKKVYSSIKGDFERGKKITKYDLEKLMFWFAKDVDMRGNKDGSTGEGSNSAEVHSDGESDSDRRESGKVGGRILVVGG